MSKRQMLYIGLELLCLLFLLLSIVFMAATTNKQYTVSARSLYTPEKLGIESVDTDFYWCVLSGDEEKDKKLFSDDEEYRYQIGHLMIWDFASDSSLAHEFKDMPIPFKAHVNHYAPIDMSNPIKGCIVRISEIKFEEGKKVDINKNVTITEGQGLQYVYLHGVIYDYLNTAFYQGDNVIWKVLSYIPNFRMAHDLCFVFVVASVVVTAVITVLCILIGKKEIAGKMVSGISVIITFIVCLITIINIFRVF